MQHQKEQKIKTGNFFSKILIHIIIIVLILSCFAYFIWQNHKYKNQLTTHVQQLQQKPVEPSIVTAEVKTANMQVQSPSVALAEAQYLIHLANINLVVSKNVSETIQLLTMADQQLALLVEKDSRLISVRQALADDLGALKMVPRVDTVGMFLKINALSDQIAKLPVPSIPTKLVEVPSIQVQTSTAPDSTSQQIFWQRFMAATWQQLQKIIIIKHHDQPLTSILSEEQQIDLIQKMQLTLNQAEWAIIYKQADIYQAALQKVTYLANSYFVNNPAAASGIINVVKELQTIDINPKIPELTTSLTAIDKVIQSESSSGKE